MLAGWGGGRGPYPVPRRVEGRGYREKPLALKIDEENSCNSLDEPPEYQPINSGMLQEIKGIICDEQGQQKLMYVRRIGNKICFTCFDTTFCMLEDHMVEPEELAVADKGGGHLPLTETIYLIAHMREGNL